MGRFLVLLSLLSSGAFAAVPGNAPILTIAASGQQTQALSIPLSSLSGTGINGVFSLYNAGVNPVTGGNYYPLIKNGALYQVTAGKTAYCFNITAGSNYTSALSYQLVSGTASTAAAGSSTITGGVYQCGASAAYCQQTGNVTNVAAGIPGVYVFSASTWPVCQPASGSQAYYIHMECYEQ